MKFWDASAVVPLLVRQRSTETMRRLLAADAVIFAWWGTPVECISAVARLGREKALDESKVEISARILSDLADAWNEVEPTPKLRHTALRLLRTHALRAGDACQLAAAIVASNGNPRDLPFVCLDERLSEAARKEGFTVLP